MGKDWRGNRKSLFVTLGASNHTDGERQGEDYYATDPVAIDALFGWLAAHAVTPVAVWEPSCGAGHLSRRMEEGYGVRVVSSDLVDRGYGTGGVNFFEQVAMPEGCDSIITNPPYKYATEYVEHAMGLLPAGGLLALFLKTTFAEGRERYRRIFSVYRPLAVLQCVRRVLCAKNGDFGYYRVNGGSAASYAWWLWRKGGGRCSDVVLDWINF